MCSKVMVYGGPHRDKRIRPDRWKLSSNGKTADAFGDMPVMRPYNDLFPGISFFRQPDEIFGHLQIPVRFTSFYRFYPLPVARVV